jgi:hypothetical protein
MKYSLSRIEYGLWVSIILCQFAACSMLVRRRDFSRHWKVFSYYLFYMASQSVILLAISILGSPRAYAISYSLADFIESVLLCLVVLEILVKVLDPFEALPGRAVARFCFWAVLGIATSVALSVIIPGHHTDVSISLPLAVERTIFLADAVLLWMLLSQSKSLGIVLKSAEAEIAIGFVVYLTVQATTKFMVEISDYWLLRASSSIVGQLAYLIALIGWIWTITHRDPRPARPTAETLALLRELSSDFNAVPKNRIFAAVGIRASEPALEENHQDAYQDNAVEEPPIRVSIPAD